MSIKRIMSALELKHKKSGITVYPAASELEIRNFETQVGFEMPEDFKEFYLICNGFECSEDLFRLIPLYDVLKYDDDYGKNWFHFAEYMIFSDVWAVRKTEDGNSEIFNKSEVEVVLTTSFREFLEKYLEGSIFEEGGLYDWHKEVQTKNKLL